MESLWDTTARAPVYLFAMPDERNERNRVEIGAVPGALSFLGHGDFNAPVKGLKEFPKDQRPPVLLTFLSFRIMVGLGTYFAVMMIIGIFIRKRLLENPWYLRLMMVSIPLPFLAHTAGWVLAEVGRQPWIVYGLMRTADAVSPIAASQGTLFTLLNPYGLIGGVLFVLLFVVHGALWLAAKTQGDLQARAAATAAGIWVAEVLVAVVFLAASYFTTSLYANYLAHPLLFAVILVTVAALFGIRLFLARKAYFKAWFASALTIVGATFYGVIGLFPNMFPSSLNPAWNLTAHNASSSQLTLTIMLVVVLIFVPLVLAYQAWAYNLFKGRITDADLVY
jgi:hypothetical protein